ncbi:alpha/beta fold hydrolase [Luteimonas notoginsengisoli]|uniref:Alpha/beta fold hydrolase n=1 Tax=Luteimonas notoginsengisoli TaxID=1578200 RepID=A0ABV7UWW3_9GAMM
MTELPRGAAAVALGLATCLAGGCTSLGERIAQPHSAKLYDVDTLDRMESTIGVQPARFRTPDGVTLAYAFVPPAMRGMMYTMSRGDGSMTFAIRFGEKTETVPTTGSVIFLHGWGLDASSMLPWALALSELGYQGVVADLRNHGHSSRAPAGFGTHEAQDVAALVEHLQAEGRLRPPVYLFGVSYGAATALFAEPLLRDRVTGIVAMESYAAAGDGVRGFIAGAQADRDDGLHGSLMRAFARWRYDAPAIERGVRQAGQRLGLDLDAIDVRATLAQTATCTLLLHGAGDRYVPVAAARSLADASPLVRYRELPDESHLSLPLRIEWLARPLDAWLQQVANGECSQLRLPPDPLAEGGPSQFSASGMAPAADAPSTSPVPPGAGTAPSSPTEAVTDEPQLPR